MMSETITNKQEFNERVLQLCEEDTRRMVKQFQDQFLETDCPVCLSANANLFAKKWGLKYKQCNDCGLIYISPYPNDEIREWYFANSEGLKFWREQMPESTIQNRMGMYLDRVNYIQERLRKNSCNTNKVLEVGSGNGELAQVLREKEVFDEIILVEPQPLSLIIERCEVVNTVLADAPAHIPGKVDVILAFEVLEHINDPIQFVAEVRNLLNDNGLFVLSTPSIESLEIQLLKEKSPTIMFDHVRLFGPNSIKKLFPDDKWEVIDLQTPGKSDIATIVEAYKKEIIKHDYFLKYICNASTTVKDNFQEYLQRELLSSHMKVTVRKK
jgi:2-polyprenyl-3-methyl-5-hydroxy-6-metoxy-1,4-benzoquinol methylase